MLINFAGFFFVGALVSGCADKKIAEEKEVDRSHNIFTGNDTVTEKKESTYQNRRTGKTSTEEVTTKTKYDENGKKISQSTEMEKK